MAVPISQLDEMNAANMVLIESLEADLRDLSRVIDLSAPDDARDLLLEVAPSLEQVYSEQAAVASAEWYENVRRQQVGGTYYARLGEVPARAWVEDDVRWAAAHLFTEAPEQTLTDLSEAMIRKVLFASRDTIGRNATYYDRQAAGWQRIARPGACDFCLMLAGRGGVYKRATADFASHNNCRCRARPSWDDSLPEVDVQAYEQSKRTAGLTEAQKESRRRSFSEWKQRNQDELESYREAMADIE